MNSDPTTQMQAKENSTPVHLWQLDVLRGIAILMVVLYHLQGISYRSFGNFDLYDVKPGGHFITPSIPEFTLWATYPIYYGQSGVVLFFVLSGFCIHYSILLSQKKAAENGTSFRFAFIPYLLRRAWRILPAYLITLTIIFAYQRWQAHLQGEKFFIGIKDYILHVLMLHNLRPNTFQSINPSFWSLAVEWQFYLIYPAFLFFTIRFGVMISLACSVIVSIVCQIAVLQMTQQVTDDKIISCWSQFPLITWFHWCLGAFVAEYWHKGRPLCRIPGSVLLMLWVIMLGIAAHKPLNLFDASIVSMLWPVMFTLTLQAYIQIKRSPNFIERLITPIGLCSYSMYLIHQPILKPMLDFVHQHRLLPDWRSIDMSVGAVVIVGVLFAISWFGFKFVETPFIKIGRSFEKKRSR